MTPFEQQFVDTVRFDKEVDDFRDRQDYLAAILRKGDQWFVKHSKAFDGLPEELADWFNEGIDKLNAKDEIDEFPDYVEEALEETEAEAEAEEVETTDEEGENGSVGATPSSETGVGEGVAAGDNEERGNGVPVEPVHEGGTEGDPPPVKGKGKRLRPPPRNYIDLTGEKDRFGIIKGTKTSDAMAMFEKGATAREIDEKIGGRFYNKLNALAKEGHQVVRNGDVFKLTHKDDVGGT